MISAMRPPVVYIFTDGDRAGRHMANKIAYALRGIALARVMECPWGPIIDYKFIIKDGKTVKKAVRRGVDPAILPPDYINRLYDEAPIVMKKIKWTFPPLIFDPAQVA
jgi:hypothetical protein